MKTWIAFWNILKKDVSNYYLKPPNISWGIIFPIAWTLMFYIRSASPPDIRSLLPGVMVLSVLFGTTSMLAVTITFERRGRSFDRLLLAPLSLFTLILAKTCGAALFGMANAAVPLLLAAPFANLGDINWLLLIFGTALTAIAATFMGLFVAVSVREVFEAQTLSNFFRFPMIFLCGLFFPVNDLPSLLRPMAYLLPPTYGEDIIRGAIGDGTLLPLWLSASILPVMTVALLWFSLARAQRRWIL
ncbi:MAG: ABC transporter permease [Firmicutes bacterium]|jgi:ABC-2 type transport system permease protein|nr:ABC transporter permease [Bacillota bacterium]